jgi:hypothetical protein
LADILRRMRHGGCGGLAGKAELLTGIDGVSSRPVQRIGATERAPRCASPSHSMRKNHDGKAANGSVSASAALGSGSVP